MKSYSAANLSTKPPKINHSCNMQASLNAMGPDNMFFIEDAFALIADEPRFVSIFDKIKAHNAAELEKYRAAVVKKLAGI